MIVDVWRDALRAQHLLSSRWVHNGRLLACAMLLTVSGTVMAAGEDVVTDFHQALIANMKAGADLSFKGRTSRLAPVIDRSFNFDSIARVAMGSFWKQLSGVQKLRIKALMRQLTLGSYAENFDAYSGESFRTIAVKDGRRGQRSVHTELVRPGDSAVQFDYVLRKIDEHWQIINVLADGVSDLALKRAEYGSIMRKQGIVELLQQIDAQIKRLYPEL